MASSYPQQAIFYVSIVYINPCFTPLQTAAHRRDIFIGFLVKTLPAADQGSTALEDICHVSDDRFFLLGGRLYHAQRSEMTR
jgi:hypothetical protein